MLEIQILVEKALLETILETVQKTMLEINNSIYTKGDDLMSPFIFYLKYFKYDLPTPNLFSIPKLSKIVAPILAKVFPVGNVPKYLNFFE